MTRRVAPESRPAELLAAGLAQLRAKGSATTVEDVTRAAGTAKGSFYRYFDSWDDFLDAVREQTYDEWLAAAAPLDGVAGADDFWARLEGEVGRFVDFLDELGPAHDVLFHGTSPTGDRRAIAVVEDLFAVGRAAGGVRPEVDGERAAAFTFAVVHAAGDRVVAGDDRDAAVTEAIAFLRGALA
jgi:AcrR family transcriptional regulator